MPTPVLLCYSVSAAKLSTLRSLTAPMGICLREVRASELDLPLKALPGAKPLAENPCAAPLKEEMLVMSGFPKPVFDLFLNALKAKKVSIPLKAVMTPTNAEWSSRALHEAIRSEHEAMHGGKK